MSLQISIGVEALQTCCVALRHSASSQIAITAQRAWVQKDASFRRQSARSSNASSPT
jgi:hypothetical protein